MEISDPIPATEPPTDGQFVMCYDKSYGWWRGKYMPDDQVEGYQATAWDLIGLYGTQGEITHWMPMPPGTALPRARRRRASVIAGPSRSSALPRCER